MIITIDGSTNKYKRIMEMWFFKNKTKCTETGAKNIE